MGDMINTLAVPPGPAADLAPKPSLPPTERLSPERMGRAVGMRHEERPSVREVRHGNNRRRIMPKSCVIPRLNAI